MTWLNNPFWLTFYHPHLLCSRGTWLKRLFLELIWCTSKKIFWHWRAFFLRSLLNFLPNRVLSSGFSTSSTHLGFPSAWDMLWTNWPTRAMFPSRCLGEVMKIYFCWDAVFHEVVSYPYLREWCHNVHQSPLDFLQNPVFFHSSNILMFWKKIFLGSVLLSSIKLLSFLEYTFAISFGTGSSSNTVSSNVASLMHLLSYSVHTPPWILVSSMTFSFVQMRGQIFYYLPLVSISCVCYWACYVSVSAFVMYTCCLIQSWRWRRMMSYWEMMEYCFIYLFIYLFILCWYIKIAHC